MNDLFDFPPRAIRERLTTWWAFGEQARPCILGQVCDGPLPETDDLEAYWSDETFIIARKMAEIEATTYYGEAVPCHYVDQGSSAMAGVLGCPMRAIDKETVWADPCLSGAEAVPGVRFDRDAPLYRRIRRLTLASCARAAGHHMVAPFALEGMTDLMAALYGLEPFLIDCVTEPEPVARGMEHLQELWLEAWADIQSVIRTGNPGGIGWAGIWAPGTTFPIQEDVAYNISPAMFERFCIPRVRAQAAVMDYPFFHLDGIGMLPHLDALLAIPELKAIQWQPGAGHAPLAPWTGLLRRILQAGKSLQVYARAHEVEPLVETLGSRGVLVIVTDATHENMRKLMAAFGAGQGTVHLSAMSSKTKNRRTIASDENGQ